MRKWLEICIAACFYYTGFISLVRWWKECSHPSLVVLIYHRATAGDLRSHLLYLSRHYRILHLEEALAELYSANSNSRRGDRRAPLVLTFDDGYYDNYTHAFALANELRVPITVFLIPGYLESGSRFWWEEGAALVAHAQVDKAALEGKMYHLDRANEREGLVETIGARVRHATSVREREEFLASVREALAEHACVPAEEKATLPLTWAEVRKMEESGWVSFGAHTMHHPILGYLADPAEMQYEVSECRAVLERQLGHRVRTFAYPVGEFEHIGENAPRAVREAGYDWALTAINGFNTSQTNPYLLHRLMVDVDQHWLVVAAKASGVWGFFSRLFRFVIQ